MLRLALLQHACPINSTPAQNLRTALDMIRDAAAQGAQVVVTQELFTSQYFPQVESPDYFALAQTIPGPTTDQLASIARKHRLWLVASLFEKRTAGLYHNTAVTFCPKGEMVSRYRKMHIPDDPRFYEKYYFTPGDAPHTSESAWQTAATDHGCIGTLICWDQWYPEAARLTALRGAQVLLYPTAIGWWLHEAPELRPTQRKAWRIIQRSHAIANGVFVAAVNRIGVEGELRFWGSSFICDPSGTVIAEASEDQPCVLVADCDLSRIESQRHGWPFLRDRRIDAYHDITKRWIKDDG